MKQNNAQGEMQLVAEWLQTLPASYKSKTHVKVGAQALQYAGPPLNAAQQRALGVWSSWADARVFTGSAVWIVEAKLVATGGAYGQLIDYLAEYPSSEDYEAFAPAQIQGIVLCMASRAVTASRFLSLGIQTVIFQPTFPLSTALAKLFPAAQVLTEG